MQSGGGGNIPTKEQQKEVARQVMKDLGLAPNDIESLQKMEWAKLIAAGNAAVAKINPPGGLGPPGPGAPGTPRAGWAPCVDGKNINMRSFFDAAPEISKNVPMLIGSVTEEGNRMSSRPTEEEWHANLAKAYGDEKATAIIAALKKSYPHKNIQTLSYMCGGAGGLNGLSMRNNVVKMAKLKHELKAAPAYAYYFTWQTPMLDGLPARGTRPNFNSASTTPSAANREPATHPRRRRWRRRWPRPGRPLPQPEIRACRA